MEFHNVSVDKNSNTYFDGRVTSRNIRFPDGSLKTLGVMLEGEYEFNTSKKKLWKLHRVKFMFHFLIHQIGKNISKIPHLKSQQIVLLKSKLNKLLTIAVLI